MDITKFRQSTDNGLIVISTLYLIFLSPVIFCFACNKIRFTYIYYLFAAAAGLYVIYISLYIWRDKFEPKSSDPKPKYKSIIKHTIGNIAILSFLTTIVYIYLSFFHNCAPTIETMGSLEGNCSVCPCIEYEGNRIDWIAIADDIEGDFTYYKFLKKGPKDTEMKSVGKGYSKVNQWPWTPNRSDIGFNTIYIKVIDKKHKNESDHDAIGQCDCTILPNNHFPEVTPQKEAQQLNNITYIYFNTNGPGDFSNKFWQQWASGITHAQNAPTISSYFGRVTPSLTNCPNQATQHNPDQSNPDQSNPDQSNPDQSNPDQSNPDQSNPDQSNPDQNNPDQMNAYQNNAGQSNSNQPNPSDLDTISSSIVLGPEFTSSPYGAANTKNTLSSSIILSSDFTGSHYRRVDTENILSSFLEGELLQVTLFEANPSL